MVSKPSFFLATSRLGRRSALVGLGILGGFAALGATALLGACASDSTGGQRVVLNTRLGLSESSASGFTTGLGWTVTVTKALVSTGSFAYFDGAPPTVQAPRHRNWKFAQRLLGLNVAHAHPGHYAAGGTLGDMLENWSVDLLAGTVDLPVGEGITGTYRSARFSLHAPPEGPLASALEGHVALVEGVAEKNGQEPRYFRATADEADLAQNVKEGAVDGCEFSVADVQGNGTVTVLVHLDVWFNLVDFSELEPGSEEAPSEFPSDSQPRLAFAQDLTQLSAYKFSFSAASGMKP